MKNLLQSLSDIPSVRGSMMISRDGIMIASAVGPELREDAMAALSSALVMTMKRNLEPLGLVGDAEELVLNAEAGKLVFVSLGEAAYLVVITRPNLHLDNDMVEIRGVARRLRERCVMS